MSLQNSIKQSVIIGYLLKIKKYADNSKLFSVDIRKNKKSYSKKYRTWIDTSLIYRLFIFIDRLFNSIERKLYNSINTSLLFGFLIGPFNREKDSDKSANGITKNSYIIKFLKWFFSNFTYRDILIFIPASYVVVDYVIRLIPFLGPLGSIWDELVLVLCFFVYFINRIYSGGKINYNFTPMDLPLIIYIVLGICHVFIKSPTLSISIEGFRAVYQQIFWYFIATQFVKNINDSEKVINLMIAIGLFLGLHATYQYIAKVPMPGNWVDVGESISTRAYSIIGSPNVLGSIFVLFIPLAFSMGVANKEKKLKLFYYGTALFMTGGLLFTMSRGAWLAFAFGVFVYILAIVPKLIIPFAGLGAVFILFGGALSERLLYMLSPAYMIKSAAGGRIYRWTIGFNIWQRNQLFGLGLGRYGGAVAMNNNLAPFYLDNYYLKTLTEMGLFGMFGLLFVIISFIIYAVNIIRRQRDFNKRIVVIGMLSGCLGVLAQNFVENILKFQL